MRRLSLAVVVAVAVGLSLLIARPHNARVAVAKPRQRPAPRSYAAAATVAAAAARATPKPRPVTKVTPAAPAAAPPPARARADRPNGTQVRLTRGRPPHEAAAPPVEETAPEPAMPEVAADTAAPPPEPLEISDARVTAVSASGAEVTFQTNLPARTVASFGIDGPAVWTAQETANTLDHTAVLTGLSFSTTYHVWLHALDAYDQSQTAVVTVKTAPTSDDPIATTAGDRIVVDGQPFFPLAVWAQCSDGYASNIADGINVFMGDGCGGNDRQLPARVAGDAFSIVDAKGADATGRGVIGRYFPDEWDAFLPSNVTRDELEAKIPHAQTGKISFLTLTNHFYSRAASLPQGRGMYPALYSLADVVGFDLYPLQVWCRPAFGDVFDAQHELNDVTGGKPTLQWIEVARMEHPCHDDPANDPTPATVRAETWLAIAGGADGIGYFPNRWQGDIGAEIARTNRQIRELSPALLSPQVPVTSSTPAVRVSGGTLNGAIYVVAVNTGYDSVQPRITVDGVAGRSATVLGDGTVVGSDDTGFTDTFGPLAAKVYVIPPPGW